MSLREFDWLITDIKGDCVDLVLLGASWHKDRARELRGAFCEILSHMMLMIAPVPPTVYTTFYIGAFASDGIANDETERPPHFQILFTTEYGLSRDALEELNFIVKNSDHVECRNSTHVRSYCTLEETV